MRVTFWGTRGSLPKPGRETVRYGGNTSCVQVVTDAGTLVVLDCGTGAHGLGQALMGRGEALKGHILISHTHWDHIQGLPFFTPLFVPGNEWDVWGPRGLGDSLKATLAGQMQYTYFPVTLDALRAEVRYHDLVEGVFHIDEIEVTTRYLNHPALTLGFRLEADGASVAYVCDHEPHSRELADGRGDLTGQDLEHADWLREADLVIHDAQYTPTAYPDKVGWGHSTADYAVQICRAAGVRRLALTHHDPLHDDDTVDRMMEGLRGRLADGGSLEVFAAREGETIHLVGESPGTGARARPDLGRGGSAERAADTTAATRHQRVLVGLSGTAGADAIHEALQADGVDIVTCDASVAAAECYRRGNPQLVILEASDEGLGAAREIRALGGEAEEVPVLLVGSEAGSAGEVSEWLTTPFSVEYARSRIRAWLLRVESRWVAAPRPEGEEARLAALRRLALLDSGPDERFDRLTRLAAGLLGAPISLVSLVDRDRQWFKSRVGLDAPETPRDASFCAHAILGDDAMVVADALEDDRFADNPLVAGPPHIRFYAGCPLRLPDGHAMGSLCVIDTKPRSLTEQQRELLRDLADLVEEELARA